MRTHNAHILHAIIDDIMYSQQITQNVLQNRLRRIKRITTMKKIYTSLAILLLIALIVPGCGKKEETPPADPVAPDVKIQDETEVTEAPEITEAPAIEEKNENENKAAEASPEPEEPPKSDAELPEYLTGDFVENSETVTEGGIAEGANTYEGEILSLTQASQNINIGDEVTITGDGGSYSLKIESIEVTDERNEFLDSDPGKVVKVRYTYTATSEEPVLVGQICFRLMNTKAESYEAYLLDSTNDPEAAPVPSENGTPVTASLAFAVNDDESEVTLIFDDAVYVSGAEYYIHAGI